MLATDPPWGHVSVALGQLSEMVGRDSSPVDVMRRDQLQAYIRDTFRKLEVPIDEQPWCLYSALVTGSLLVEMAHNGYEAGAIDGISMRIVAELVQSLAIATMDYIPEEFRK